MNLKKYKARYQHSDLEIFLFENRSRVQGHRHRIMSEKNVIKCIYKENHSFWFTGKKTMKWKQITVSLSRSRISQMAKFV